MRRAGWPCPSSSQVAYQVGEDVIWIQNVRYSINSCSYREDSMTTKHLFASIYLSVIPSWVHMSMSNLSLATRFLDSAEVQKDILLSSTKVVGFDGGL